MVTIGQFFVYSAVVILLGGVLAAVRLFTAHRVVQAWPPRRASFRG